MHKKIYLESITIMILWRILTIFRVVVTVVIFLLVLELVSHIIQYRTSLSPSGHYQSREKKIVNNQFSENLHNGIFIEESIGYWQKFQIANLIVIHELHVTHLVFQSWVYFQSGCNVYVYFHVTFIQIRS